MTARREAADITRAVAGQTLCAMFQAQAAAQGDAPALHTRRDGAWRAVSWREYARRVEAAALALMTDGLAPGQAVALLSGTREEYNIADLGVTHAGGIPVTLYQSLAPGQVAYIVAHAEAVLAFAENAAQAEKLLAIRAEIPLVRYEYASPTTSNPWLIAKPSVIAGKEHVVRFTYNDKGQKLYPRYELFQQIVADDGAEFGIAEQRHAARSFCQFGRTHVPRGRVDQVAGEIDGSIGALTDLALDLVVSAEGGAQRRNWIERGSHGIRIHRDWRLGRRVHSTRF